MSKRSVALSVPCTGEEEWHACREPLMSGWLTQGPKVSAFEEAFAKRHGVGHAVANSNCTTSLHMILLAMGVGPGDEVIVPAFTWVATANAVLYVGANPVFADIDPVTFNVMPEAIERRVSARTKAVVAVHLFGLCADIDAIKAVLRPGIALIEDAACAAGASANGRVAGGLADAAAFSFHPRKSITTGEGGMVTCNDTKLADALRKLRNHGAEPAALHQTHGDRPWLMPDFNVLGYNYRMTDLQGAVGLVQLAKLDKFIDERNGWAEWYRQQFSHLDWLRLPQAPSGYRHAWQAYVLQLDPQVAPLGRNALMDELLRRGISTRPGTHAVHMLALYRDRFGLTPEDYPNARDAYLNSMAIPMHNRMVAEDYQYVADTLLELAR